MKQILIITISLFMLGCSGKSEAEKAQEKADKMIAEAMEKAEKLKAEAEAKVKKRMEETEAAAEQKKQEAEIEKQKLAEQKELNLKHTPNQKLSIYNGLYVSERSSNVGALIFVDGKLCYFSLTDFTQTYKNEEYNIKGITDDGLFDIKAKYYKDRNDKVHVKEAILKEGKPKLVDNKCVSIDRSGLIFTRNNTLKDLMASKRNWNYPLDNLIKDVKDTYSRSNAEIEKALNRTDFYKCNAFTNAAFYGDKFSFAEILESIIKMP